LDAQGMILGLLQGKSLTGYELKKIFSISFAFFSGFSFGSIYPALRKMEKNGLISMRLEIQSNAPNRKIYTLTDKGQQRFREILRSPVRSFDFKSDFLSRIFFFSQLTPEERMEIGQAYLDIIEEKLGHLDSTRTEIEERADAFQRLGFEFGIRLLKDLSKNVKATMKSIEKQA
jgi:DNA-binding PadR family transcriptional regulator